MAVPSSQVTYQERSIQIHHQRGLSFLPKVDNCVSSMRTLISNLESRSFNQSAINTDYRERDEGSSSGYKMMSAWGLPYLSRPSSSHSPGDPVLQGKTLAFPNLPRSFLPPWLYTCCVPLTSLIGQLPAYLLLETPFFVPHLLLDTFPGHLLSITLCAEKGISPLASHVILFAVLLYHFTSFNTPQLLMEGLP